METPDRLHPADSVDVAVYDTQGREAANFKGTGYHDVAQAVNAAWDASGLPGDIKDYAYQVSDAATGVSHRYRVNAHGNLRLVV